MELIFKYNENFYRKAAIMKIAREATNKSWNTITRWIEDTTKWNKLEEVGIFPYLAAKVLDNHMVVTTGDILNLSTLRRIKNADTRGKVTIIEDGDKWEFWPSSLVYYKFLLREGEAFDPERDTPFLVSRYKWSPDISNLESKKLIPDDTIAPQYVEDQIPGEPIIKQKPKKRKFYGGR